MPRLAPRTPSRPPGRRPGTPTISRGGNGLPPGIGVNRGAVTYKPSPRPPGTGRIVGPIAGGDDRITRPPVRGGGRIVGPTAGGDDRSTRPPGSQYGKPVIRPVPSPSPSPGAGTPWSPSLPTRPGGGGGVKPPKPPTYSNAPGELTADQQIFIDETIGDGKNQLRKMQIEADLQKKSVGQNFVRSRGTLNRAVAGEHGRTRAGLADQGLALSERFAGGAKAKLRSERNLGLAELSRNRSDQMKDISKSVADFEAELERTIAKMGAREGGWRSENKSRQLRGIGL
jgi:hypothetical protein